ncbi:hypothetical protein BGX27_000698, partial [Mortierella sp. AM989]
GGDSSSSEMPEPPTITDEFSANFIQQKWGNQSTSQNTSGVVYISASNNKARIDTSYNGIIRASVFDFTNITSEGFMNKTLILQNLRDTPRCEYSYVPVPAHPPMDEAMLKDNGAVFAGWTQDDIYGRVETWNFLYYSSIPTSFFIDEQKQFVRYDFWVPQNGTFATTRFYNIQSQNDALPGELFDLPC